MKIKEHYWEKYQEGGEYDPPADNTLETSYMDADEAFVAWSEAYTKESIKQQDSEQEPF